MRNGAMTGAMLLLLAGCGAGGNAVAGDGGARNVALEIPAIADPVSPTADAEPAFAGMWTGPEGLSFVVERNSGGGYRVRNRDTLDTEQAFDAVADGGTLRFVRRGKAEAARSGTGAETGYKWLANKKDCLIVTPGVEGYCRD